MRSLNEDTKIHHFVERASFQGQYGLSCHTTTDPDPNLDFNAKKKWEMTLGKLMHISNYTVFWHDGELMSVRRSIDTLDTVD